MSLVRAVTRALVRCYPADFRARYASDVEESTRALVRRASSRGTAAGALMAIRALVDLARSVVLERRLSRQREGSAGPGRFRSGSFTLDLRNALRQVARNPGFAVAAVLTLALSMGGVTAVFRIADPVLFKPLPYPGSDRIVQLTAATEQGPFDLFTADYLALLADPGAFDAVATASTAHVGLLSEEASAADTVFIVSVSQQFFDVFAVEPMIGRRFRSEEHVGASVAVITHDAWRSIYGGRADIVGQSLSLRGSRNVTFEIVGVLPRGFLFPPVAASVNTANLGPIAIAPDDHAARAARPAANSGFIATPFGRLAKNASIADATATLGRAMAATASADPASATFARAPRLTPIRTVIYGEARRPMTALLSVTAFVMVLALANLAHLFMARLTTRGRELATRRALGASSARLVRMLIVEAAVIALAGAGAAFALGNVLTGVALRLLPPGVNVYEAAASASNSRVILMLLAATGVALLVVGVLPALGVLRRGRRVSLVVTSSGRPAALERSALVLAQTATAVAVVLTAVLLAASFARLAMQDLGFNPNGVQTASIASPANAKRDTPFLRHINLEMQQRIERLAGTPVAIAAGVPGRSLPTRLGHPGADQRRYLTIGYPVSESFFDVFDIQLRRGRLMTRDEVIAGAPVLILDERAAALSWPGGDALGRQLQDASGTVRTVIGVVAALKTQVSADRFQRPTAFFPLPAEHTRTYALLWRGTVTPGLAQQIRSAAKEVDPGGHLLLGPLNLLDRQLQEPRFLAILLGALGILAVVLTIVGLYAVVSHAVAQRTREMGIRIALGAAARGIVALVMMQTLKPAALGVALGLSVSLWWTETLRSLLYGFSPHDWRVFGTAGGLVLCLVALACVLPIRRATRVDPLLALKSE